MKAVITVVGKDCVGILAGVSNQCAKYGVNILEVSQTVLQEMFCMIMVGDISDISVSFGEIAEQLEAYGKERNLQIHAMHEDIFNSMHKI